MDETSKVSEAALENAYKPIIENAYKQIMSKIFFDRYEEGATEVAFERDDLVTAAEALGIPRPGNLGDILYAYRYRDGRPEAMANIGPAELEWVLESAGRAKYVFKLRKISRIVPNEHLAVIRVPDGTPEIVSLYALGDEQALLARLRYNRLIDIFLGLTTYSLQNHLRTTVRDVGQIEIDELYVGLDTHGCHYTIPVQAKGGTDTINVVQTGQDIAWCRQEYPELRCRPISAQFMDDGKIAMFEVKIEDDDLKVVEERHYQLVAADSIDSAAMSDYKI